MFEVLVKTSLEWFLCAEENQMRKMTLKVAPPMELGFSLTCEQPHNGPYGCVQTDEGGGDKQSHEDHAACPGVVTAVDLAHPNGDGL